MPNPEFKRFTQPGVLMKIQLCHLVRFFDPFKDEMKAKNCWPAAEPGCEGYYHVWAGWFTRPELLPAALVDAVRAIEKWAVADGWVRLQGTILQLRKYGKFGLDNTCSPESQALQVWLWCPFTADGNLAELQGKVEEGKKAYDEKVRIESEAQKKRDEELRIAEGASQNAPPPRTPTPSNRTGEPIGEEKPKRRGPILPAVRIDSDTVLARYFMSHQINWITAEEAIHSQGKQVYALAEKSVRIGWTHADSFKNVRKRLRFKDRNYLFVTRDYPSALDYVGQALKFADAFDYTKAILAHGEDYINVERLDKDGKPTGFKDEVKMGYIKFDNGSSIRAFSAHPQAMAVYGGDVGLDEFAKHPNARLLWETAQSRVTWAYDIAVWSAHNGEDTLFYQFAQEARAGRGPWNLYYRVTMVDAIELGLLKVINRVRGTMLSPKQFLEDCKARSRQEDIYEQAYMCNPAPAADGIVEWSSIARCLADYEIERVHFEADDLRRQFGDFRPQLQLDRARRIRDFIRQRFHSIFQSEKGGKLRLGFDVAASGSGDLMVIYIDEKKGSELWLRGLFTCRTSDWDFIKTVLFAFMQELPYMLAAGDSTGLGQQICWEAEQAFPDRFSGVSFSSRKHDLGFALMNQLSMAEKRFPRNEQDIAADYFALRKSFHGSRWIFSEGNNALNPNSHCDIAWAGGLATEADVSRRYAAGGAVVW